MIAVEPTLKQFPSPLSRTERQVNNPPIPTILHNFPMEVILFDTNPIRRKDWSKLCQKRSVALTCLDSVTESALAPTANARILVFDKSVVDDCLHTGHELVAKMPFNIVAFSVPQCSVSVATRLMKSGARWVFDNDLDPIEFEGGFSALMQDAANLNAQLKHFKRVQSLRAQITPGEQDVLELVIKGVPNKTIAAQLDISTRTVEARRARVYRKCEVQSITELVRFFDNAESLQKQFAG